MKAILAASIILTLASPYLAFADSPRPRYTTLIVEYSGETIGGPAPPVVITTSQEEGEWYRQHVLPEVSGSFAEVQVVPQSVLNEITEFPLLSRALKGAKPVEDQLKTNQNARFTVGIAHDHVQIVVAKQPSTKILKGIDKIVAKYPSLKNGLHMIEYQLK
jgi:hypothetical protein